MRFYVLCEEGAQDLANLMQLYLIDGCRHYKQKVFRVQSHQTTDMLKLYIFEFYVMKTLYVNLKLLLNHPEYRHDLGLF